MALLMKKSTSNTGKQASPDGLTVPPSLGSPPAKKHARKSFAAAVATASLFMISSTAPASLEGASARATAIPGDEAGLYGNAGLFARVSYRSAEVFADYASVSPTEACPLAGSLGCGESPPAQLTSDPATAFSLNEPSCLGPNGAFETQTFRFNAVGGQYLYTCAGAPSAVRSTIADSELLQSLPAVAAPYGEDVYESHVSPANGPSTRTASILAKLSAAPTRLARPASSLRPAGCSRCAGQIAQFPPTRAKSSAFVLSLNFFRKPRLFRRERLPGGVARQREAPQLAAWNFVRPNPTN